MRTDLEIFFLEMLRSPLSWSSGEALVYVVGVMANARFGDRPLCLEMAYAGPDRIVRLQEAADEALLVSGFFPERAARFGLPVGYYDSIGSIAYRELASRFPSSMGTVLAELAAHFPRFRRGVGEVRKTCDMTRLAYLSLGRHDIGGGDV